MDDLDAGAHIYVGAYEVEGLWRDFSVVVRVHSGAFFALVAR
jgi:hypothetical protein